MRNEQPYTKKQIKSSRKLQGQSFMFASWGYWDGLPNKARDNWKRGTHLRQRPVRRFGANGK